MPRNDGESHHDGPTGTLLGAIGISPSSYARFVEWALAEHLVSDLARMEYQPDFFMKPDARKHFMDLLSRRTKRRWSQHDELALFDRVKAAQQRHAREPITYEDLAAMLWSLPLKCAYSSCGKAPPDVQLEIDHIVPVKHGGRSTRANLQFLCRSHNRKKGAQREVTDPWLDLK